MSRPPLPIMPLPDEGPTREDARRLLVLAYRFPPQGRVGAHRTTKFVKYLVRFGWQPVVHTVSNPHCAFFDATLSREVPPEVPIYRTPTLEFERLEERLAHLRSRVRESWHLGSHGTNAHWIGSTGNLPHRMREYIWRRWLVPDPQIAWLPGAILRSLWIARRHSVSAIYSSSPPHSVQLAGLALRRQLGLPWIADLRDPWTEGLRRQQLYERNGARRTREERWERLICQMADRVLVASDGVRTALLQKYPECSAEKITCIPNGFDPDDFVHVGSGPRLLEPGLLHVTLAGNVDAAFDLTPLFTAVRDLLESRPTARKLLRLNFIGTRRRELSESFRVKEGLEDVIRFHPHVDHETCLQMLAESPVALLAAAERFPDNGVKLSAKLYEYLYLRKPVLALITPGPATRLLAHARLGVHCLPGDVDGIRNALAELLDRFAEGGVRLDPDEAFIAGYDRRTQVKRLAEILDEVTGRRPWYPNPATATHAHAATSAAS